MFTHSYAFFIIEVQAGQDTDALMAALKSELPHGAGVELLGRTTSDYVLSASVGGKCEDVAVSELESVYYSQLDDIFPYRTEKSAGERNAACEDIAVADKSG